MNVTTRQESPANIAVGKSRVKEYDGKHGERVVYLKDGDEFQIELFNPYNYEIGFSIAFNDKRDNEALLVLKPGERFWLDRYINTPRKFKFSTYEVENTEAVRKAISENGKVTVKIFKEKEERQSITYSDFNWKWNSSNPWSNPYSHNLRCRSMSNVSSSASTITTSFNCMASDLNAESFGNDQLLSCSSMETGRIEQGSESDQSFTRVDKKFEDFPFRTLEFQILPLSQKPVSTTDLTKRFCHECGRKIKEKFKFCPFCGTEQ